MANVLTNLAADIYKAAEVRARELVGIIPSVTINGGSEAAAQGDPIRAAFTRAATVNSSATPSMTIPEGDDQTVDNKTMTITQIASVRIPWTGEDIAHVNNGAGYETIYGDQIYQAFRGITNAIENYAWGVVRKGASRAYGTAGTAPFASAIDDAVFLEKILADNGLPADDNLYSLILDTTAAANLKKVPNLYKVSEAGTPSLLRQGIIGEIQGFMCKRSNAVGVVTKGTGSGYLVNNGSGYAAGSTTIAVDTGTGTVLAGDILTGSGDTNKYVVGTTLTGGSLALNNPGLRATWADNLALTVGNNFTANLAIHQSAVELVSRPLKKPLGGDAAIDVMDIVDPVSGLAFQLSVYKGYNKAMIDVTCLYDVKVWKPEGVAILLG